MYNIDEIKNKIICGDCLEELKKFPDNSIDTIITDPPYNLVSITKRFGKENSKPAQYGNDGSFSRLSKGFMGKEWDGTGIAFNKEVWEECFRVVKPGATLMAFGSPRTYHRLTCAIEDAGWIIKDCIMWLYGSGFPKATDISKQLDKKAGKKRKQGERKKDFDKYNSPNYKKINPVEYAGRKPKEEVGYETIPATPEAKLWNGWKSHGLKPAYEPIIMAMKPNEGSYAENALKWGVAGLNIDESRVETSDSLDGGGTIDKSNYSTVTLKSQPVRGRTGAETGGRFPANLIHDGSDEVVACFPNSKSTGGTGKIGLDSDVNLGGGNNYYNFGDSGSASRFFKSILYYPKASKSERNKGMGNTPDAVRQPVKNNHPTVKPLKLMEYLCLLTKTPTGGIVLDPFAGSGTTCMAAKKVGRDFIGIEKEPDYVAIAEARIKSIPESLF